MKAQGRRSSAVVHWSDGTDLEELDDRSRAGDDLSAALEAGVVLRDSATSSASCAHNNHLVAVPDGGMPVVTVERQRAHQFSTTCPTCGNTSFIRHAELFPDG